MKTRNNKYSVLVSTYKEDNPVFLEKALESIYDKQTEKPNEVVIVIDGPINKELKKTIDFFKKDKEKVVKCVWLRENKGLGEALKEGIKNCTGDYIFRMDSDDISDNERFEKQIDYLEKNPSVDVLGGNILEFKEKPDEEKTRKRVCPQNFDEIKKMARKRNPMNHVTTCIKKATLLEVGNYQSLLYLEDYYLWLRMIVAKKEIRNLDENLVFVRIGNGFEKRRGNHKQIEGWDYLQRYMLNNNLIKKRDAFINRLHIRAFVYSPAWFKKIIYRVFLRK